MSLRWALNPRTLSPMKLMSPTPGRKPKKCFRKSAHKNTQTVSKHIQIHLTCGIKHCKYKGKTCPRDLALHLLEQLKFGGGDTILPQRTCKLSSRVKVKEFSNPSTHGVDPKGLQVQAQPGERESKQNTLGWGVGQKACLG